MPSEKAPVCYHMLFTTTEELTLGKNWLSLMFLEEPLWVGFGNLSGPHCLGGFLSHFLFNFHCLLKLRCMPVEERSIIVIQIQTKGVG